MYIFNIHLAWELGSELQDNRYHKMSRFPRQFIINGNWVPVEDPDFTDGVADAYQSNFAVYVIPGLTRNPDHFQYVTPLDAGSGPA